MSSFIYYFLSDVYNAARRVVEAAALANAAAEGAQLADANFNKVLLNYHQLAGHQVHSSLPGIWTSGYTLLRPLDDILSLNMPGVEKRIKRLRRHSYGGPDAPSAVAPIASGACVRHYVGTRPPC